MDDLKSLPIVSWPGSFLHELDVWVDRKLQEDTTKNSYFDNFLKLKKQLQLLHLPPSTHLFTADGVSMYTNIPTHTALNLISKHSFSINEW